MLVLILLTCHTDRVLDREKRCGEQVRYIDLAAQAEYYRAPPVLNRVT